MQTTIRKSLRAIAILTAGVVMSGIVGAQADIILIDFGKDTQTTGTVGGNTWNNSAAASGAAPNITNLVDTSGAVTGISLTITRLGDANFAIGGSDVTGVTPTPNAIQYPESATRDQAFNASTESPAVLTLSGLSNSLTYNLTFFGLTPVGERWTEVTIGGTMQAYNSDATNDGGWVTFSNIVPTAGSIAIELDRGSTGTSGTSTGSALSVMEIAVIPEPGTSFLLLAGFVALAIARRCTGLPWIKN